MDAPRLRGSWQFEAFFVVSDVYVDVCRLCVAVDGVQLLFLRRRIVRVQCGHDAVGPSHDHSVGGRVPVHEQHAHERSVRDIDGDWDH